jgi:C-terminal processing protease CtpA/Prc
MNRLSVYVLLFIVFACSFAAAQTGLPTAPQNLDLSLKSFGDSLHGGWRAVPALNTQSYKISFSSTKAYKAKNCIEIDSKKPRAGESAGLMQSLDARDYRGKTISFRVIARLDAPKSTAEARLVFHIDRPSGKHDLSDDLHEHAITSKEWTMYEIAGKVDSDATAIDFGFVLKGTGKAYFDHSFLDILTAEAEQTIIEYESSKKLSERELANLVAFSKLYGYIKYFYPSDESTKANWDNLAINGVKYVESAADDKELSQRLNAFFAPIAPLARVLPKNSVPPPPEANKLRTEHPLGSIAWYHSGVGVPQTGLVPYTPYSSKRIFSDGRLYTKEAVNSYGGFHQTISTAYLRGKKVTFSASLRTDETPWQGVTIWIEPVIASAGAGPVSMGVVANSKWQRGSISYTIPDNADSIRFGASLRGGGTMWMDDAELTATGIGKNLALDPGFEALHFAAHKDWEGSPSKLYSEDIDSVYSASGKYSGMTHALGVNKKYVVHFPSADSIFTFDLGGGVVVRTPISLWLDESGAPLAAPGKPNDTLPHYFIPNGGDRFVRLADVAIAWNIFEHFFPYFDVVKTDWNAVLGATLASASESPDKDAFQRVMQRMIAKLHDGHGNVYSGARGKMPLAPFFCQFVEGKIVVTATEPDYKGNIRRGDILVSVNGMDANAFLDSARNYVSSATEQWSDYKILSNIFEYIDSDVYAIQVVHANGKTETVMEKPMKKFAAITDKIVKPIEEPKPGIMYVDIERVSRATFDSITPMLAKAKAIIFDMRGYPRGLIREPISHIIDAPVWSARWNFPQQLYPDQLEIMWDTAGRWPVRPASPRFTKNIIHLMDGRTISQAETYMGMIEAYHIGDIVGSPSAGTNGDINPFTLPGGYTVWWTGQKVLKHDGSRHHGVGILPTIYSTPTIKGIREGKDEVLEKAIETAEKNMK